MNNLQKWLLTILGALLVLCMIAAIFSYADAQTTAAPVVQLTMTGTLATNVSQCLAPTSPAGSWCPVISSSGVISNYFWNGSAFVLGTGAQGPMGPQGPAGAQGPQGATGAQGSPGPVQSFNSNKCTTSSLSNTGIAMSGCVQSNP